MKRRTVYLQEIGQVQDILQIQRNALQAFGLLQASAFGKSQDPTGNFATIFPGGTSPTTSTVSGGNYVITVPALVLFEYAAADPGTWPLSSIGTSILQADSTNLLIQGYSPATSNIVVVAAPYGGTTSDYITLQAQLQTSGGSWAIDNNNQVLAYQSLIQTLTSSSTSTVSKLYLVATTGMSSGDQVVVQGFGASGGASVFINGAPSSDGGGPFINISPSLTAIPGTGVVVKDVNPNAGAPLAGPSNSGTAQPIDRVPVVTLGFTAAHNGSPPAASAGWIPLWSIGPFTGGGSGSVTVVTHPSAPIWPGLIGAHHHYGPGRAIGGAALPSQSAPIDLAGGEASYAPVNKAGDAMTGTLALPGGPTGGTYPNFSLVWPAGAPFDPSTAPSPGGVRISLGGFIDFITGGENGLRWNPAGQPYSPVQISRITTGGYIGNGASFQAINFDPTWSPTHGWQPLFVLVFNAVVAGASSSGFVAGASASILQVTGANISIASGAAYGNLTAAGFQVGSNLNVNTASYTYVAWG